MQCYAARSSCSVFMAWQHMSTAKVLMIPHRCMEAGLIRTRQGTQGSLAATLHFASGANNALR